MRPDEELLGVVVHSGLVLAHSQDVVAALGLNRPGDRAGSCCTPVQRHAEVRQGRPPRRQPRHQLPPLPALRPPWPGGESCRPG